MKCSVIFINYLDVSKFHFNIIRKGEKEISPYNRP
jgi:hypothetical protein